MYADIALKPLRIKTHPRGRLGPTETRFWFATLIGAVTLAVRRLFLISGPTPTLRA